MRWSAAVASSLVVACATSNHECLDKCGEAWERRLKDIHKQGGLVEECPPIQVEVMVHFDEPPGVEPACVHVPYASTMPDCASNLAKSDETGSAICRAVHAFPDQVALLGSNPRVDARHEAGEWRVRL